MSLLKSLYSRKFFLFNLVLVGVLVGFALAFVGFSAGARGPDRFVRAETRGGAPVVLVDAPAIANAPPEIKSALAGAESVQSAFRYVAKSVLPSVVEVKVVETKKGGPQAAPSDQFPWRFFFGQPDDQQEESPKDYQEQGLGSGIIVRRDGSSVYVLTNNHVAGEASDITVVLSDDREFKATLVGKDERKDLALVKFETSAKDIVVATLGDSSALEVGDWAIAIGSPFGFVSSVTIGTVSALGRSSGPDGNISDFIQTDAAINRGNSGGALVNIRGEVVGINTWIASPTGGSIGLGFAIPINNAKKAIDDFITRGKVEYGWLGVSLRGLDKASSEELGVGDRKGAFVAHVFSGSPADKAGFLPGDYIVEADGAAVRGQDQVVRTVGDLPVGRKARFAAIRDGKRIELEVTIEARKDSVASNDGNLFPGLDVISLKSEDIDKSKLPKDAKGILVTNVFPKSPAATVGLKPGDIVTEVNEKPVAGLGDFFRLLNDPKERKIAFTVNRDGQTVSTLAYVRK